MPELWKPCHPIEGSRQDRFRPSFCPWEDCPDHLVQGRKFRFKSEGSYPRKRDSSRNRRFQCLCCGRSFSISAFSVTYRMKRPELVQPVAELLNAGCAERQIARALGCSKSTVNRIAVKLGEHSLRMQREWQARIDRIVETIVFDEFETFHIDQTQRIAIGTAIGTRTGLVYGIGGAPYLAAMRRSPRRPPLKSPRRPTVPGSRVARIAETLVSFVPSATRTLDLVTDDNPLYRSALKKIGKLRPDLTIQHRRFANPDRSPGHDRAAASKRDRAMFLLDRLHNLLRHSQKHHVRETIAFARKFHNAMARTALFAVWRNFIKLETERRPTKLTPAIKAGLADKVWTWADVFSCRLFDRRIGLRTA